jgi:uncharacterized protein YecE (DUF72 family)
MTSSMTLTPSSVERLHVGSSGWSYPSWRPAFYPAGTDPGDFLRVYAEQLRAVELNATVYRLPSEEQFRRWASQVPDGFRFAVKAPRDIARRLGTFEERVRALGDRLGCVRVVVETPRDDGLLELLLGSVDPALRWAFDLRDPSWDGVEERLATIGAVRVGAWEAPAGWRYLRFRDPPYDERALAELASRVQAPLRDGAEVFAFFRHEEEPTAPRYARRLLALSGGAPPERGAAG